MSSRLLSFSLGLNLVLLGVAGYWTARNHSDDSTPPIIAPTTQTNLIESNAETASATPVVAATSTSLRWSEIESEDFPTYVANLRKAGCPEPVLRRIIEGELKEVYAQKAFALVQEFHRDFWKIAARENVQDYFEKTLGPQVKALGEESNALLKQLVGEDSRQLSNAPSPQTLENRSMDFLSSDKQEQLRQLAERYEARMQAVRQANLPPKEKTLQLTRLRREMEKDQATIFSPEEWAEYRLRQSASELQQLYGVDFSETEQRKVAKVIDDYHRLTETQPETNPEELEQALLTALGPERFADFDRARSATYRELYEVASDFDRPAETAAELFDLRLQSEKKCDEIRADKNQTAEGKQVLLDELEEQVERAFLTKFGAEAYQSYKARSGRWINSLGRL